MQQPILRPILRRALPVFLLTTTGIVTRLQADVLYSNLQGNYLAQQTGSYTYAKSNSDYGATGFGTYYNTGYDEVTLSSISFYGGTGELYNASTGSLGDGLVIYFFDASGNFDGPASIYETTLTQGVGLHTVSGFSVQIPGAGYVMFDSYRAQSYNVQTGYQTPLSPGPATFTADYGAAPTVGQTDPTVSEFMDTNRNLSTIAPLVSTPAYLQLELDGTGSGASYYPTATPIWNFNGSSTWDNSSNWTLGVPNGVGATANFTGAISTNATVTLVAGETVGIVNFDNPSSYTLAGGGTLTLTNTSGAAVINSWAGSQTISAPTVYTAGLTANTPYADPSLSAPDLTLPLGIVATGTLTKTGIGTLAFAASTSGITTLNLPSINISAGTVLLQSNPVHTNRTLLTTGSLTVASGKLDLGNNDLDDSGDTLASINALVASGYAHGAWNGSGITSSAAASDSTHLTALGVIQNNQGGSAVFTAANPFDGTTPGASDILIKYTYYGDANLDGRVDGSDYTLIDNGYLNHLTGWFNGDFNYDGVVDGSDYTLIDNAFNSQGVALAAQIAFATAQIEPGGASAVPEPASVGILMLTAAGLLRRRRRA